MNKIKLLVVMLFSITVAACGGGGDSGGTSGGTSAADTAVGSILADETGSWEGGLYATTTAHLSAYTPTATANTYSVTSVNKQLASGVWTIPTPSTTVTFYMLGTNGWVDMSSYAYTLLDSGDGGHVTVSSITQTYGMTIAKTSLSGGAIACSDSAGQPVACTAPGNYPVGAAEYTFTTAEAIEQYYLFMSTGKEVTNAQGVALTALPAVGSTLCDPRLQNVFQPITPAPAAGANNYSFFTVTSCAQTDIATALAGVAKGTIRISSKSTGNAVVPSVLLLNNPVSASNYTWMDNQSFGVNAGAVWLGGYTQMAANTPSTIKNKIAINAELTANGLPVLP